MYILIETMVPYDIDIVEKLVRALYGTNTMSKMRFQQIQLCLVQH